MNVERLQKVVETLDAITDRQFHMGIWLEGDSACGSVGCAVGHYIERNPNCGLILIFDKHGRGLPKLRHRELKLYQWDAVAAHFDISLSDVKWLFDYESYTDKEPAPGIPPDVSRFDVAFRIETLIDHAKRQAEHTAA